MKWTCDCCQRIGIYHVKRLAVNDEKRTSTLASISDKYESKLKKTDSRSDTMPFARLERPSNGFS